MIPMIITVMAAKYKNFHRDNFSIPLVACPAVTSKTGPFDSSEEDDDGKPVTLAELLVTVDEGNAVRRSISPRPLIIRPASPSVPVLPPTKT